MRSVAGMKTYRRRAGFRAAGVLATVVLSGAAATPAVPDAAGSTIAVVDGRSSAAAAIEAGAKVWSACLEAVARAEEEAGLPRHLLRAIATVESGRRDEADNRWKPWPWTINNAGDSYFLDAKADAVATVEGLQGEGETNIDVGCMQVNLRYHPDAFETLEEAFDPAANTAYAARLLRSLYNRHRSWVFAVALYHSPKYKHSFRYRQRVMRTWAALRGLR